MRRLQEGPTQVTASGGKNPADFLPLPSRCPTFHAGVHHAARAGSDGECRRLFLLACVARAALTDRPTDPTAIMTACGAARGLQGARASSVRRKQGYAAGTEGHVWCIFKAPELERLLTVWNAHSPVTHACVHARGHKCTLSQLAVAHLLKLWQYLCNLVVLFRRLNVVSDFLSFSCEVPVLVSQSKLLNNFYIYFCLWLLKIKS